MDTPNMTGAGKGSSVGPVIGLILILAILIIGSLYFWGKRAEKMTPVNLETTQNVKNETGTADAQTQRLQTQSSSDDTTSIESDLNATDFQNVGNGSELLQ